MHHQGLLQNYHCEFFFVFMRAEYALKAAGFCKSIYGHTEADWNKFDKEPAIIELVINPPPELKTEIDYILTNPPKKQIFENGQLAFVDTQVGGTKAHRICVLIRRVRNNLFHGAKFISGDETDERNKELIEKSTKILKKLVHALASVWEKYSDGYTLPDE